MKPALGATKEPLKAGNFIHLVAGRARAELAFNLKLGLNT